MNVFLYLVLIVWNYDVSVLTLSCATIYKIIYGLVDIPLDAFFKFSTNSISVAVNILLNYIILIPESMHVPTHSQFVLLHYGIVCQLLQYCHVVYRVLKSQLKELILIMLCLVNISLCCMCFRGFNLCFICLFRPICV